MNIHRTTRGLPQFSPGDCPNFSPGTVPVFAPAKTGLSPSPPQRKWDCPLPGPQGTFASRISRSTGLPPSRSRTAFTLVELLVTITIIGILAGVVFGALSSARETAREAKTKSLITRLDRIIMQRYESYRTRRVPVDTSGIPRNDPQYVTRIVRARLDAVRDLMRMEMPDRWADVTDLPIALPDPPGLSQLYKMQYDQAVTAGLMPSDQFAPAECLYMIVATGSPEDREQFTQGEIGDADGDGWLEFHDGWGMPISFLRWAPGFNVSDVQPNIEVWDDSDAASLQARQLAAEQDHDPFDPRRADTDMTDPNIANHLPRGWRLVPLIYSNGPDKDADISQGPQAFSYAQTLPYAPNPYSQAVGEPVDVEQDGLNHYDNIHNHHIEAR